MLRYGARLRLKVALIMKYVAGEETVCVYRLKVKDAITLGGTASCGGGGRRLIHLHGRP